MDVSLVIRHRLNELGLEQRDLVTAAHVTESYISQLLTGKKAPHGSSDNTMCNLGTLVIFGWIVTFLHPNRRGLMQAYYSKCRAKKK
jgi:transcriptional regulator with XRE-family HTH domain